MPNIKRSFPAVGRVIIKRRAKNGECVRSERGVNYEWGQTGTTAEVGVGEGVGSKGKRETIVHAMSLHGSKGYLALTYSETYPSDFWTSATKVFIWYHCGRLGQ